MRDDTRLAIRVEESLEWLDFMFRDHRCQTLFLLGSWETLQEFPSEWSKRPEMHWEILGSVRLRPEQDHASHTLPSRN